MSLDACADLVARGDPDRYLTVLAAPLAQRARLLPIYAFNVEVTRAPWVTQEPMIAEMRLQWWRDALEEIGQGGDVRAHEVSTPLAAVIDADGAGVLDRLVAARRWDVYSDPFEDDAHFEDYLDATAGGLMWVAARALGARPGDEDAFRALGWAAGLASLLVAIPDLEARGRKPLVDGREDAVARLAETGFSRLRSARNTATGPASFPAWQAGAILRRAAGAPWRVSAGALATSEFKRRARMTMSQITGRVPG